jgi:DNA-binding transcriptional MerR regulator
MKNTGDGFFTIGEMAKKFGITVRTLQHYDRTGLLKSTSSESGRRIYMRDDILKLQQILFLKSFGFSLQEIKNILLNNEASLNLEQVFEQQRDILLAQISNYNKMVEALNTVIEEVKAGKEISVYKLMIMIELMKNGNPYRYMIRYFEDDLINDLSKRFQSQQKYDQFMEIAKELFTRVKSLKQQGADPAGEEGQKLANDWWNMVMSVTNGDPKMIETLVSAGMDIGDWPDETGNTKSSFVDFLSNAFGVYFAKNEMSVFKNGG